MRIGLDLDGVIYDFGSAFRKFLIEQRGWDPKWCTEPTRWEFYEDWGLNLEGFKRLCHVAADSNRLWCVYGVLGGASVKEHLLRLKNAGHTIHIITHRGFGSHRAISSLETSRWLCLHEIPYDTLTFCGDKTIIKTDFMIEDNVDNYVALEKSGCQSVLINRPWNSQLENARRVDTVAEFVDMILREDNPFA